MQSRSPVSLPTFAEGSSAPALRSGAGTVASLRVGRCSTGRAGHYALRVLDFWHLLSLDAPSVAVVWLGFVAFCTHRFVGLAPQAALFLAVWIIYAADRLLDAGALWGRATLPSGLQIRHSFHLRHRRAFCGVLVAVLPALAWLLFRLPGQILRAETALALALTLWLLQVHAPAKHTKPQRLAKEFAVGGFFALAVFLPFTLSFAQALALMPAALLFAGLCTLNCLFLYAWEHPDEPSDTHPATVLAARHAPSLSLCGLAAAIVVGVVERHDRLVLLSLACFSSVLLLLMLHAGRHRISPLRLRALADLALLTPLPLALLSRAPWHTMPVRW